MTRALVAALAVAAALAAPASAPAAGPVSYVRGAQNADGGLGSAPSAASSPMVSGWAALGLAARGHAPARVRHGGRSLLTYVRATMDDIRAIGDVERTVLVVRAAGKDPRRFAGRNLVREILDRRRADGSIAGYVSYTSFGILALRASGVKRGARPLRRATAWLLRQQNDDGGFNTAGRGGRSGIDDTGYAIQALVAAGRRDTRATRRGARFIARSRNADGGYPLFRGIASNAQSSAYAVQGLVAAGTQRAARRSGLRYLRSLVQPNGLVRYSRTSAQTPVWVTSQALLALAGKRFPLAPVR
jgi:prenyltransferase beta subunit